MVRRIEDIAAMLAEAFSGGRWDAAVAFCDEPFALHIDEHLLYARDRRSLAAVLDRYRSIFGIEDVTARVVAIEIPRQGRFRTWIDWRYSLSAGPTRIRNRSILYGRIGPKVLTLEMAQFTHDQAQRNAGLLPARLQLP